VKAKHQRLTLLGLAIVAVLGACCCPCRARRQAPISTRRRCARKGVPLDRAVRIGGMVRQGSIQRAADGVTVNFTVGDETAATIPVRYTGITPDLFKENSGVVAEGRFQPNGTFVADEILAKHDENYMPPELARDGAKHKTETLEGQGT
jgi:cytochrome c-type biogenesis protein CcmE